MAGKPKVKRKRRPAKPKVSDRSFEVIRDSREKAGFGWDFPCDPKSGCRGTVVEGLPTGDYTVRGLERVIVFERKASTGEFAQNISQARFERELERLEEFAHAFVVLEFDMNDINNFPANSGIPQSSWRRLRVTPDYLRKRLVQLMLKYKTQFILVGKDGGKEFALTVMKRLVDEAGGFVGVEGVSGKAVNEPKKDQTSAETP